MNLAALLLLNIRCVALLCALFVIEQFGASKVNAQGQVEGTSAGTSIAFDAAFYYQRPVGTGPHGYGSVLSAGAAMYKLLEKYPYEKNGPVMFRK